ncbi:hypothetical protein Tco_0947737 [Tanacetum coccineum]
MIENISFLSISETFAGDIGVESLQASSLRQDEHLAEWAKSSTSMAWNLGPRKTSIESTQFELHSEISYLRQDTSEIKPQPTDTTQTSPHERQVSQRKGKGITTKEQLKPSSKKLVPASREVYQDPDKLIRRKAKKAKLLAMTMSELIKVVFEEDNKAGINPTIIESAKCGEQFKKIQDAEHQVLKREHT